LKVFVSGYALVSSLGNNPDQMFGQLLEGRSNIQPIQQWKHLDGLHCHLGAYASAYDKSVISRQARRTMSPMSEMATLACMDAMKMAALPMDSLDFSRSLMVMGSTTGSPLCLEEYFQKLNENKGLQGQSGTSFFKVMNHSVAANVAIAMGFNGVLIAPSSACATSSQSIIMGWEMLQSGLYDFAICGGADELHYLSTAVFDSVYAASRSYNDKADQSPRPFDKRRDGLVVSEGASVVILENEKSLARRGGRPLAEMCGGAYFCESSHISQNNEQQMVKTMKVAMDRAQIRAEEIEYVNAHATGTLQGDAQEASAVAKTFGSEVPISSLKAHFGHSMAACGGIEFISILKMMESGVLIKTKNLEEVAPECQGVFHLHENLNRKIKIAISNNFAFGGINTSLIVRSMEGAPL
jgi:3-oxoacyl-[acyl-carrier-protein] synthase II